jgi:hypothetical protein
MLSTGKKKLEELVYESAFEKLAFVRAFVPR